MIFEDTLDSWGLLCGCVESLGYLWVFGSLGNVFVVCLTWKMHMPDHRHSGLTHQQPGTTGNVVQLVNPLSAS